MRNAICVLVGLGVGLSVSAPTLGQQTLRLPNRGSVVDFALAASGKAYVLHQIGLDEVDLVSGATVPHRFDAIAAVPEIALRRTVNLAVAEDPPGRPVILWFGRRLQGPTEFFITTLGTGTTVRLLSPDGLGSSCLDFVLGAAGQVYILAAPAAGSPEMIQEFSADGRHVGSYHSPHVDDPEALGHSYLTLLDGSIYVVHGLIAPIVYEYRDGRPTGVYDLGDGGRGRVVLGMYGSEDAVWVHSLVGRETLATDQSGTLELRALVDTEQELWSIKSGRVASVRRGFDAPAPILGTLPDGSLVSFQRRGNDAPFLQFLAPAE